MADGGWAVVQTLVGGGISLVTTLGVTVWSRSQERKTAAEQLAKAFLGELEAIVHIVERRDYIDALRKAAEHVQNTREQFIFAVRVREEYRVVYKANAHKLGLLPGELPVQIPIIFTQVGSVLEDFATLVELQAKPETARPEYLVMYYTQLADLMSDTLEKARTAIAEIRLRYPPT